MAKTKRVARRGATVRRVSVTPTRRTARTRSRTTRKLSTREYGLPVSRTWKGANYAYPRGAGGDRGKRPSYPIVPKSRARAARTYAARKDTAGSLSHVDTVIRKRYGSVSAIYSGRGGVKRRSNSRTARGGRGGSR